MRRLLAVALGASQQMVTVTLLKPPAVVSMRTCCIDALLPGNPLPAAVTAVTQSVTMLLADAEPV